MSEVASTQPPIKIAWLVGTFAAFMIFALIAAYSARMTQDYEDYDQQRADVRYDTLHKLQAEAAKTLTSADWVDQDKGVIRIPIEEAMVKELDTLKAQPPAICVEIAGAATPAPVAPKASDAGATNAAPAATAPPAAPATKPTR